MSVVYGADDVPEPEKLNVDINVDFCGGKVESQDLIVDAETRGLKNVVVRLENIRDRARTSEVVTVTNRDCAFDPHVQVARKGSKIAIQNADPILHTTHPYMNGRSMFNVPLTKNAPPFPPQKIRDSGVMKIKCDVHKWMEGWVIVHDNGFVGVSDEKGRLTLEGVPPGTHPYVCWHEKLGEQKGTVTVKSGGTAELKLVYPSR